MIKLQRGILIYPGNTVTRGVVLPLLRRTFMHLGRDFSKVCCWCLHGKCGLTRNTAGNLLKKSSARETPYHNHYSVRRQHIQHGKDWARLQSCVPSASQKPPRMHARLHGLRLTELLVSLS